MAVSKIYIPQKIFLKKVFCVVHVQCNFVSLLSAPVRKTAISTIEQAYFPQ